MDWKGSESNTPDQDFTVEDAKSTIGLLIEMHERLQHSDIEYEHELRTAIERCSMYGLHYSFNSKLVDRLDNRIVRQEDENYNISSAISGLKRSQNKINEAEQWFFRIFQVCSLG